MKTQARLRSAIKLAKGRLSGQSMGGVVRIAGGTALAQAIGLLVTPVLTRLYTPADFGVVAAFTALCGIALAVASLRLELAIPIAASDEEAAHLICASMGAVVVSAGVLGIAALQLADGRGLIGATIPAGAMWLVPVSVLGGGVYVVLSYAALRRRAYADIGRTRVTQAAARAITQTTLGFVSPTAISLIGGEILGQANGIGVLGRQPLALLRRHRDELSVKAVFATVRKYRHFPLYSAPSSFINTAGLQLPPLVVTALFGTTAAGLFSFGWRLSQLPMQLIGASVAQVYYSEVAHRLRQDAGALRGSFRRATKLLLAAGVLPLLVLVALGPGAVGIVFGQQWSEAGTLVQVMALALAGMFVVSPLSQTLNLAGKQHLQFAWDVFRLAITVASFFVVARLGGTLYQAVTVYSATMLAAYVVLWVIIDRATEVVLADPATEALDTRTFGP